ncbi:uncharacterized protein LOC121552484 [Coregonus clupeaformis]|uniref:uncharacterized protein LOC121552484 n=1 Tax=Coregonus clupeaformis TaxID=59861 RepID=UPI001BDFAD11|nr:uncharacterized protein LOC121552484 [Coregonus clupeaformis]
MATEGGQDGQRQEKVVLKRKLTGPPRLLLGKSKSKNQGGDRSEAHTKKRNKRVNINNGTQMDSSTKQSNIEAGETGSSQLVVTSDDLHMTSKMDEEQASSEVPTEPSRWHSTSDEDETSEGQLEGHSKTRKSTKHGWRRLFSPALICIRRQRKKYAAKTSIQDGDQGVVRAERLTHTEAKSTGEDTISLSDKCVRDAPDIDNVMKRRRRFTIRTWPTFKRLLTASYVRGQRPKQGNVVQEVSEDVQQQPSVTFRKTFQHFLMCGRRAPSAVPPLGDKDTQDPGDKDTQDTRDKETEVEPMGTQDRGQQCTSDVQGVELLEEGAEVRGQCTERVTVCAEVSTLQSEDGGPTDTPTSPESLLESPIPTTVVRPAVDTEDTETSPMGDSKETEILEPETITKTGTELLETETSFKTKLWETETSTKTGTDSILSEVINVTVDTNEMQVDELYHIQCLEKNKVIESDCAIIDTVNSVAMDTNEYPSDSNQIISSENAAEDTADASEENDTLCRITEDNIVQNGQPLTNISIIPGADLDQDVSDQDGHEVGDESSESGLPTEGHRDLLLCGESLLVQTARFLVQAAMSAAIDQLSMEQRGTPTTVHRGAQGCQDYA